MTLVKELVSDYGKVIWKNKLFRISKGPFRMDNWNELVFNEPYVENDIELLPVK